MPRGRIALLAAAALAAAAPGVALAGPDPVNQPLVDGCQRNPAGLLTYTSPEWVWVGRSTTLANSVRDVEGPARLVHTADEDLPQGHDSYDLDFDVTPDPQYAGLLAGDPSANGGQGNGNWAQDADHGSIHVEWESGAVPTFAWPTEGDRVHVWGQWAWDCGHWGQGIEDEGSNPQQDLVGTGDYLLPGQVEGGAPQNLRGEQTELHPIEALVVTRQASWQSPAGERETDAFVSDQGTHALGEERCARDNQPPGGLPMQLPSFSACVASRAEETQALAGRSFTFLVPAPPRPSAGAQLRYREVQQVAGHGYSEQIAEVPDGLQVTVSFGQGTNLAYGESFFVGWDGAPSSAHLRLTVNSVTVNKSLDPNPNRLTQSGFPPGEYNLYLNANGYWNFIGGHGRLTAPPGEWAPDLGNVTDGQIVPVKHSVDFYVPPGAPVRVDVSGRECDLPKIDPCVVNGEVSDANDHPGESTATFASAAAALGPHSLSPPSSFYSVDYSIEQLPGVGDGPSPPGSTGVASSASGGDLGGRGGVIGGPGGGVVAAGCFDAIAPQSSFLRGRGVRIRRSGIALRGSARDLSCGGRPGRVARVTVALARRAGGGRCRYLQPGGSLGPVVGCRQPTYIAANGGTRWSLRLNSRLPRGTYTVRSRALDSAGNVERKTRLHGRNRNFVTLKLR